MKKKQLDEFKATIEVMRKETLEMLNITNDASRADYYCGQLKGLEKALRTLENILEK